MTHISKSNYIVLTSFIFLIFFSFSCRNDSSSHHFKNGSAKYQLQDYTGAIKDLDKAIEINSKHIEACYTRAICYSKTKKYEQALSDFNTVLELDPNHLDALFNRAYYVKEKTGDFKGAIQDYDQFIKLNKEGNIAFALNNKGYCKYRLDDFSGAINDINRSIELQSDNSYAFRYRAEVFIAMDSLNAACTDLHKAIELGYSKENDNKVEELIKTYCIN